MSEGTLYEHIHEKEGKKTSPLPLAQRLKIAAETAEALAFLHHDAGMQIIHCDVKTTKILLDENLTAKLSGFGASRLGLEDENQISTLVHGTAGYEDPEYLDSKSNTLTEKSDVYSFGVVLAELLTGLEPEKNLARFFVGLVEGPKREERPSMKEVAAELNRLVRAMGPHPSGGEEGDISPSPKDIGNLVGSSASIASVWDTITSAE
ncbi:hypothetical protein Pyn_39235 [Prunus yedoensis var. nudiflora]|uniref:Protein kinase domain-containing protein n=1 Tax=Prunus yedoensis var. nudiflora TaxID=2094558 RepID=A0A314XJL2_PRUYE|nr:hypothetical protein Pyn_39235 [Prunus yedoensis var. nudiflora]